MIAYGLLEDTNKKGQSRVVKLSHEGYLLSGVFKPDDPDRIPLIRAAALRPKIYRELLERYPTDLPSDAAICKVLMMDYDFNTAVVEGVVKDFRATYQFANLGNQGILSEDEPDISDDSEEWGFQEPQQSQPSRPVSNNNSQVVQSSGMSPKVNDQILVPEDGMRTMTLALPGNRIAYVKIPIPTDEEDFKFIREQLDILSRAWGQQKSPSPHRVFNSTCTIWASNLARQRCRYTSSCKWDIR